MPRRRNAHNTRQAIARAEREAKALELKKVGATNAEIGRQLGCSESRACHIVREAITKLPAQDAEERRRLESEKLDQLEASLRPAALLERDAGDRRAAPLEARLKVVDRVLRISERRARLEGLDRQPEPPAPPPAVSDGDRAAALVAEFRAYLLGRRDQAAEQAGEPAEGPVEAIPAGTNGAPGHA